MTVSDFDRQVNRNLDGIALEKNGDVDGAICLYEENIAEKFEGNGPYDRLAIIYHKRKQYCDERRVLLAGIDVFQSLIDAGSPRGDLDHKLKKFIDRLNKVPSELEK